MDSVLIVGLSSHTCPHLFSVLFFPFPDTSYHVYSVFAAHMYTYLATIFGVVSREFKHPGLPSATHD